MELSGRLREREEIAESLRERERALETKLKEKSASEALLLRRVDQLRSRVMELETAEAGANENAKGLQAQLEEARKAVAEKEAEVAEARNRSQKLEFQVRGATACTQHSLCSGSALTRHLCASTGQAARRAGEGPSVTRAGGDHRQGHALEGVLDHGEEPAGSAAWQGAGRVSTA